ncbi:MAG: hypothetical protein FWE21_01960 [Defluviitaleaceae bacterium]|nr:hypothetical protein [Defluviitaleaceae bacterium]
MLDDNKQFETKLAILADILAKKQQALETILSICENQESLYSSPSAEHRREFLVEMGKQKQTHIDMVLHCDDTFQAIFEPLEATFQEKGQHYPNQVRHLQETIQTVLEIDVKIRAQEERTKIAAKAIWGKEGRGIGTRESNPAQQSYILQQYQQNNRNKPK